jgi:hypothetical protein
MTIDEFFAQIPKDGWVLRGGTIRRMGSTGLWTCPVTTFTNRDCIHWSSAGRSVGLSWDDASEIAGAADNLATIDKSRELRKRMLQELNPREEGVICAGII